MTHEPPAAAAPTTHRSPPRRRRAAVLVLLSAALAAAAFSDVLHPALVRALAAASDLIAERPALGAALFVLLAGVSAMLAFFSSAILVPVALHAWGATACALLLWIGWILGGLVTYALGRTLGRPVVAWALSAETLARYEHRFSERTPFGVVLLFQCAVPSEVPGYLLGLVRYSPWRYLLGLGIAELPYAVGTVYLGASFLDRRPFVLIGLGAAGALFMALAGWMLHRRLRE